MCSHVGSFSWKSNTETRGTSEIKSHFWQSREQSGYRRILKLFHEEELQGRIQEYLIRGVRVLNLWLGGWRAPLTRAWRGSGVICPPKLRFYPLKHYFQHLGHLKNVLEDRHDIKSGVSLLLTRKWKIVMRSRNVHYLYLTWQSVNWWKFIIWQVKLITKTCCSKGQGEVAMPSTPGLWISLGSRRGVIYICYDFSETDQSELRCFLLANQVQK